MQSTFRYQYRQTSNEELKTGDVGRYRIAIIGERTIRKLALCEGLLGVTLTNPPSDVLTRGELSCHDIPDPPDDEVSPMHYMTTYNLSSMSAVILTLDRPVHFDLMRVLNSHGVPVAGVAEEAQRLHRHSLKRAAGSLPPPPIFYLSLSKLDPLFEWIMSECGVQGVQTPQASAKTASFGLPSTRKSRSRHVRTSRRPPPEIVDEEDLVQKLIQQRKNSKAPPKPSHASVFPSGPVCSPRSEMLITPRVTRATLPNPIREESDGGSHDGHEVSQWQKSFNEAALTRVRQMEYKRRMEQSSGALSDSTQAATPILYSSLTGSSMEELSPRREAFGDAYRNRRRPDGGGGRVRRTFNRLWKV